MKKFIIFLALLYVFFACTGATIIVRGPVVNTQSGCDDCSGDLSLAHHLENVDCETGTPCGCSDNASKSLTLGSDASISTQTATNWPSDGTHSLALGTGNTTFPLNWDKNKGTISFDIYCSSYTATQNAVYIGDVDGDHVKVIMVYSDNNKVYFQIRHNWGTTWTVASAANAFTGGKVSITAKWDTTDHSGNYMALDVDGTTTYGSTAFTPVSGTYTTLVAPANASGNTCYIDNVKVYVSWQ